MSRNKLPLKFAQGTRFGTLTVICFDGKDSGNNRLFRCICDCGRRLSVRGSRLKDQKSCGCLTGVKHGKTKTKEHKAWCHIRDRCYNPNNSDYKHWGGKGVKVCERWNESFENFLSDMGLAPTPKHTIDRFPNNEGDYEPGNCRWATMKEQQGNRTNNHWIEYNGRRMIMNDWVVELGIEQSLFSYHIRKGRDIAYIIQNVKHVNAPNA